LSLTDAQVADLVEELQLLRAGKPFHVHRDIMTQASKRCTSPYCVDLTYEGVKTKPDA